MAYTKHDFKSGEKLFAQELNEMDEQIEKLTDEKADKKEIPKSLPASDVSDWAKQPKKPEYTAEEVGAASKEEVNGLSKDIADLKESGIGGGFTWKGEWRENGPDGNGYNPNDVVSYGGNLYIASTHLTFEYPINYGADWEVFIKKPTLTDSDKDDIVENVLDALPTWQGGAF